MTSVAFFGTFAVTEVLAFHPDNTVEVKMAWPTGDDIFGTFRLDMDSVNVDTYAGIADQMKAHVLKWTDMDADDPSAIHEYQRSAVSPIDGCIWHLFTDQSAFRWSGWARWGIDGNLIIDLNDDMMGDL